MKHILIVGGGIGGVTTALNLAKNNRKDIHITLVSNTTHVVYYPGLFHLLTGASPEQLSIPLDEVFEGTNVEIVHDTIKSIHPKEHIACSSEMCKYKYDYCIVASGSEPCYFDLEPYKDSFYTVSSVDSTLKLRKHLFELLAPMNVMSKDEAKKAGKIIVIGAGPNGCETAGELAVYTKRLAKRYKLNDADISIELLCSTDRVVPMFDQDISKKVERKLTSLGVTITYNTRADKKLIEEFLDESNSKHSKTIVWSVGMKNVPLISSIENIKLNEKRKAVVDEYLRAVDLQDIFILGDNAATKYAGTAQTAFFDAKYLTNTLIKLLDNKPLVKYKPSNHGYVISIGHGWALVNIFGLKEEGYVAWLIRKCVNLWFLSNILPLKKAFERFYHEEDEWRQFDDIALTNVNPTYAKTEV